MVLLWQINLSVLISWTLRLPSWVESRYFNWTLAFDSLYHLYCWAALICVSCMFSGCVLASNFIVWWLELLATCLYVKILDASTDLWVSSGFRNFDFSSLVLTTEKQLRCLWMTNWLPLIVPVLESTWIKLFSFLSLCWVMLMFLIQAIRWHAFHIKLSTRLRSICD